MSKDWMQAAQAQSEVLVARRRDFHRHPELAFQEVRTAGIVAQELQTLGLEVSTGIGKTGVVAVLEGKHDGPTILVRCDMDALPVSEQNQTEYVSETNGKMHACGHDGHTAIGLTVAGLLANEREVMHGRVKFIFQPAEELALGAQAMIDDGALGDPVPQVALGLHLWNEMPVGNVSVTDGAMMAGAADWDITVHGKGTHGAMPELGIDPVLAGANIVTALQSIPSRNVSAIDTAVITTTVFKAGDAHNVIPSSARLAGTYRTYSIATRELVKRRLHEVASSIAAAYGCQVEVTCHDLTPPLINDAQTSARLRTLFARIAPQLTLQDNVRTMAAEDMAVILNHVPGTYFFVGSANAERGLNYPHHHPRFDVDEDALPIAAGLLTAAVADYVLD